MPHLDQFRKKSQKHPFGAVLLSPFVEYIVANRISSLFRSLFQGASTPPPSKVAWLKRFDPYDGATTTINPLLVTLRGGVVQTTEKEVFTEPSVFSSTTTAAPSKTTTTTTHRTTTTQRTTTYRPIQTTTYRPIQTTTYRPIPTTTYRPVNIPTHAPFNRPSATFKPFDFSPNTKPQFNIFDFYLNYFNQPNTPTTRRPNVFQNRFQSQPAKQQPIVPAFNKPAQQRPIQNSIAITPKPVAVQHHHQPQQQQQFQHLQVAPITSSPISSREDVKPLPVPKPSPAPVSIPSLAVHQHLEQNVAPPLSAKKPKPTLNPKVKVELQDSGHKFINRFVVDEDEFRADAQFGKQKLEKEIAAPPVKNVKPILSPKISVHVGETGQTFINRFVLTEDEKSGKNKSPGKLIKELPKSVVHVEQQAVTQKPQTTSSFAAAAAGGSTDFINRFVVDDVNKRLFQIGSQDPPIRAPQSQIFFNNRFGDGVNNFSFRQQKSSSVGAAVAVAGQSRSARTLDKETPLFDRFNLRLPSFDHFKKIQTHQL